MKDGLQNVATDRFLMRLKDIVLIVVALSGLISGGYKVARKIDRMNDQISMLQQQVSTLQQLVVNDKRHLRRRRSYDEERE